MYAGPKVTMIMTSALWDYSDGVDVPCICRVFCWRRRCVVRNFEFGLLAGRQRGAERLRQCSTIQSSWERASRARRPLTTSPSAVEKRCFLNRCSSTAAVAVPNESVSRIIRNDTTTLFVRTAISILVVSNRNSFRVLFDKITSVHFIRKNVFIF